MGQFDIQGARKDGYSDAEIADYLAKQHGFDSKGARADGYSDSDIIDHLSKAQAPTAKPSLDLGKTIGDIAGAFAHTITHSDGEHLPAIAGAVKETQPYFRKGLIEAATLPAVAEHIMKVAPYVDVDAADGNQQKPIPKFKSDADLATLIGAIRAGPTDPTMEKVASDVNAPGSILQKGGRAALDIITHPQSLVHMTAEALPAMAVGGMGGKAVAGAVEPVAAKMSVELAKRAAIRDAFEMSTPLAEKAAQVAVDVAPKATFGAGMNATATATGVGGNIAAQAAAGHNLDDAVKLGVRQTAAQEPAQIAAGALLPVAPVQIESPAVRAIGNVAVQTGIQAVAGGVSDVQGNEAIGLKTTPGEVASAAIGQGVFAPAELAIHGLHEMSAAKPDITSIEPKPQAPAADAPQPVVTPRPVEPAPAPQDVKPDGTVGAEPIKPAAAPVTVEIGKKEVTSEPQGTNVRNEGGDEIAAGKPQIGQDEGQALADRGSGGDAGPGSRGISVKGEGRGKGGDGEQGQEAPVQERSRPNGRDASLDPVEDRSGVASDDKGAYRDTFDEASYTNRRSVYENAIEATGVDPDRFQLLQTPRQKALLARALEDKYGLKVETNNQLQDRLAIDQLLDAHQTLHGMAHVLGISEKAIGLGGKLKLRLQKHGKFLGAFEPGSGTVILPRRSNSFAHEWTHALDFHILDKVGAEPARGVVAAVRRDGPAFEPSNVSEAFAKVLHAMFYDQDAVAHRIMDLEARITKTVSEKVKAQLQAQIANLQRGTSTSAEVRSAYHKGALDLNRKTGGGDYWTQPTEMFARAMEAYVSHLAAEKGLGTEFIGKGDANYRSTAEERFAKSFPHAEERQHIFDALGDLMHEMHKEHMIGGDGEAAKAPPTANIRRVLDFDKHVEHVPNGNIIKRQMDEFSRAARKQAEAMADRARDPKKLYQRANDVAATVFYSMAGKLKMIEGRYKSKAVKIIHDALVYTPGKGEGTAQTFLEDATATTNRNYNRLANILKSAGLDDMDAKTQRQLRDLLISEDTPAPENMVKAAANIRVLMDDMFYDAQRAGLDIGYTRNGYLPRILDMPRIAANENGFLERAAEVYGHIFDRDYGKDAEAIVDGENGELAEFLKVAGTHGIDGVKEARKLVKALREAEENDGDVDAARQALVEHIDSMFDEVRQAFSNDRANTWLTKMKTGADFEREATSPSSSFTKSRDLPPEADKILEDFYLHDPTEAAFHYISQNARRVAFAKRFGPDGERLKALMEQMAREGVSKEDANQVMDVVNTAVGRARMNINRSVQLFLSGLNAYGTMRLLPRAVIASLTEPITAAMTGSDVRLGMKALAASIVGSRSLRGSERAELARALGIVTDHGAEALLGERYGGHFADTTRFDKIVNRMFERTGLVALTRAQRAHTMSAAHAYLDYWTGRHIKGDKVAPVMLKELGVRDVDTFAKEFQDKGRMPTLEELDTKWGHDYGLAMKRFSDMTIQEPNAMMRPQLANNPVGRVIYGITAFASAFWRNVLKRQINLTGEIYKAAGPGRAVQHVAAGVLPAALLMVALQGTVSTLREYFLNPQRWKDLQDSGDLESTMLQLALTRTFSLGIADPFVQAVSGLKYQRDLSNVFVGPAWGVFLQDMQKMMTLAVHNSAKSNTGEYNAANAFYNAIVGPAISVGLSYVPGGPITSPLTGFGMAAATSPRAGDIAATAIVGKKDEAHHKHASSGRASGRDSARQNTRDSHR